MAKLKILHIAPTNTSGVPGELVRAERALGHESRLVTLFRDRRGYFEDICLNLAFIDFAGTRWIKRRVSAPERLRVDNRLRIPGEIGQRLDQALRARPVRLPRHTWILEAIVEKLDRESN